MSNERKLMHIVMFPWLAFGHMIPFLNLSKLIARKGHRISFISTPRNIDRLPPPPPALSHLLNYVKIPLPGHDVVPDFPINAEATSDVPYDKVVYLKLAYDALQQPLTQFLRQTSPDWIFFDFASYWLPSVASELGIPSAYFSIFTASVLGFSGSVQVLKGDDSEKQPRKTLEDYTVKPEWVPFETSVCFKIYEITKIADSVITSPENTVSDIFRMGSSIQGCDIVAVRSCWEFEPEWLKLLEQDLYRKPVIPVGQLPTVEEEEEAADESKNTVWRGYKEWLDKQGKGSVVYVAFGSEAKPSQSELTEIALGLEQSGLPFFWALKLKRGDWDTETIGLPEGFVERTKDRGVICTSWAPQLKILSHDSVGGFLTHSGWSSVVESIQFQRPLIMLTFLADQGLNARLLEEKKIGYPIPRDESDGSFTRDSVADSLRMVILQEEGKIYRDKVKEMNGIFCDGGRQDFYVENLLAFLQSYSRN
ncbi:OLC1v1011648C1 [Oldenlandia corymbosa var. corymbosa]|uniref:OLC1v1011648C1 n=1 Tax=Oldenlandia corymbosa var. corymbosa TaxID=529605 RepID=A0AAV1DWH8_OLDCO|nr:OLC1v1011648C1 [Oldenlandia corymbosa var. corymbosa]